MAHKHKQFQLADAYSEFNDNFDLHLQLILRDCRENVAPEVHVGTLHRWWNMHEEWGELLYLAKKERPHLRRK